MASQAEAQRRLTVVSTDNLAVDPSIRTLTALSLPGT
jgi:hypothetical protein